MDSQSLTVAIDDSIDAGLDWLNTHGGPVFDAVRSVLDHLYGAVAWVLTAPPYPVVAVALGALGWRAVSVRFGVASCAGLLICAFMGLWPETMATLALVVTATALALLFAIPVGILAGYNALIEAALQPVLDLFQTLPPYIYLLPAIALMGFGPATALCATVIVAIPPALRLTAHGVGGTPLHFLELGQATRGSPLQMFFKIRLPFAMPSIMAGVNQCLMMAFGMVVIAGIVGSGGLGATIYDAVRKLDIAKSIDAALAIVILTMVLDRITEGAVGNRGRKAA
jgi:glycine betaine/proline transport system permease protein